MKRNLKMMLMAVFAMGLLVAGAGIKAEAEEGVQVIPKAEHEKMFPSGHPEMKTSKTLRCNYDEAKAAYLCPFDKPGMKEPGSQVHMVPKEEHDKMFPSGHPEMKSSKTLRCNYDEAKAAYLCPFDKPEVKK